MLSAHEGKSTAPGIGQHEDALPIGSHAASRYLIMMAPKRRKQLITFQRGAARDAQYLGRCVAVAGSAKHHMFLVTAVESEPTCSYIFCIAKCGRPGNVAWHGEPRVERNMEMWLRESVAWQVLLASTAFRKTSVCEARLEFVENLAKQTACLSESILQLSMWRRHSESNLY